MQAKQRIPCRHYTDDFKAQAVTLASSISGTSNQQARHVGQDAQSLG
jgi:transposase-like protein